jgi:NADH-quinone oxidoreductase B subunit
VIKKLVCWARKKSPWVLHFNSGGCNGCDLEIMATLSPRFDVERFGVQLKGSPRHADVLLATGPVTLKQAKRLKRIYDQMPEPKCVIAVGNCASTGDVYKGLYNVEEGIDKVLPVDVYVAGCPPRPDEIIDGVIKVVSVLETRNKINTKK